MTLIMWGLTPDPEWSTLISTSTMLGMYNLTGYSNPAYDKLWEQQTSEMDAAKRKALIDQMSEILQNDKVILPICYTQLVTAWNEKWQNVPDAGTVFGFYTYLNKTQFNSLAVQ